MIKFKIDDIRYEVPEFISIEKYVKIYKVKDLFSDDYFAAKIVSIVCDAPIEVLLESEYAEIQQLATYIMSLIPTNKPEFINRFTIDGVDYGFIPEWRDLSFAEFSDLDTLSTKKPEEMLDMLHIISAIMYRPITEEKKNNDFRIEKYNVDKMKERAELFKKKLDIKYVLGAQFFFINFANRFSDYSQLSLMQNLSIWQKVKLVWMMRKWLVKATLSKKHTDGSLSSTELLKTILQNTKLSTKRN
jgi:hypothetical protein